jgi:hypothetical protein
MTLTYKFKKERLATGGYVFRPRILVVLQGANTSIEVPALIDSGADAMVIPEGIARAVGIGMKGEQDKMIAYREETSVVHSTATIIFLGKANRESVTLHKVPVLVALSGRGHQDEDDITLGVEGIFDSFDITFKKSQNRITLKKASQSLKDYFKM